MNAHGSLNMYWPSRARLVRPGPADLPIRWQLAHGFQLVAGHRDQAMLNVEEGVVDAIDER